MKVTSEEFNLIKELLPKQRGNVTISNLQVINRECRYLVIHFRISLSKNDSFTRQLFPFAPAVLRSPRLRIPHRSKLLVPHAIMAPTMTLRR
ncbi:MAG: hypothetical protein AAES65_19740 [Candidatus Thiodiazotropha sp. (ex. Lucinoma kazani)]